MRTRISAWFRITLCVGLLAVGWSPTAALSTIVVTTTADDFTVNDNCTLREAVQAANTDTSVDACPAGSGADVITLPAGTYTLNIPGTFEDLNQTGDLDVTSSITFQGAGRDATIIQINRELVIDRILELIETDAVVNISGITFRNGNLTTESGPGGTTVYPYGGAIYNAGTLNIADSAFINNEVDGGASGDGGGIFNGGTLNAENLYFEANYADYGGGSIHNNGTMTLTDSLFYRNRGYGTGGVYNDDSGVATIDNTDFLENQIQLAGGGAISNDGSMTVTNSLFDLNTGAGGTVFNRGDLILEDSTFTRNTEGDNGVIESNAGSTLTVTRVAFLDNHSSGSGAIYLDSGTGVVKESIFDGNTGQRNGGAISVRNSSLTVEETTIQGNQALRGGGIHNQATEGQTSTVIVRRSTISGNSGQQGGGGFYNLGTSEFENSTISGNTGGPGGGIYQESGHLTLNFTTITGNVFRGLDALDGTIDFRGIILAGNSAVIYPDCYVETNVTFTSQGGSVFGITNGCTFDLGPGDKQGNVTNPLDAKLGPLADNGGPTHTHALLSGSPAINAAGTDCPSTDQRGVARPVGAACDSGAYEGQAAEIEEIFLYLPLVSNTD